MKPTPFTDQHRFPRPYRRACDTDIAATFARIKYEQTKEIQRDNDNPPAESTLADIFRAEHHVIAK